MSVVATICSVGIFVYANDLKPNLTEDRLLKMVNEVPKTIAGFVYTNDLKPNLTEVRLLKMVNEASETIASFARNLLGARQKCPCRYVREEREILEFKRKN